MSWSEEVGGASGAERTFSATLALLLERAENRGAGYAGGAPSEAAAFFAEPSRFGITSSGEHFRRRVSQVQPVRARDGWIAVCGGRPKSVGLGPSTQPEATT